MDLHFTPDAPSAEEREAIDTVLGAQNGARHGAAARERRDLLLPALHAVQDRVGWISAGAINYIGLRLTVAPAEIYGVATFYGLFSTKPRAPFVAHVCDDIACVVAGTERLRAQIASQGATIVESPCLGLCDRAPAALVVRAGESPLAEQIANNDVTHVGGSELVLLQRIGRVDPESLDAYRQSGGFNAFERAVSLGRERTIAEVTTAKLLGRGGAAFPAGQKMQAVAQAPALPHYLVCNADESEPGTFKDRVLLEGDPFAIVEAIAIAAFAIGCDHAYVYVRGEYPLAAARLQNAIAQAEANGVIGNLHIQIRRGAGAYICGEETALFNSIEGKRGEPRNKPPFPAEAGLFGKPTLINNVETLANLLPILLEGAQAYARRGTPNSTGTRLFSLSGAIARPGLYEVPHGTTLGALIELAGGVAAGYKLQALLLGGAAGVMLAPSAASLPLTFEDARAAGATLGSGVVMLFNETVDLERIVKRIARFFREESCGQCVPCRIGTVRQEEALERRDGALIAEIGRAMRDASICGLGQTASSVVESARVNLGLFAEARS